MSQVFQSYTPRTRPFEYDSLQQDVGCQDITTGTKVFNLQPMGRICIVEHDAVSSVFNKLDTVSITDGPANTGNPPPWPTRWAAWVSGTGVRVAKLPAITPPSNSTGNSSSLFPTDKPTKLSVGFTSDAQIAIAIQKTEDSIQLKWITELEGVGTAHEATFTGVSPLLFNNIQLHHSDDAGESDLVVFYLRPEIPRSLFARFERESYGTEYVINANLQAPMANLLSTEVSGRKQLIYGTDIFGRDITLHSLEYVIKVDGDEADLSIGVSSGRYYQSAVLGDAGSDEMGFTIAFVSGLYDDPIQEPASPLSGDKASLTIGIVSGDYST